MTALVDLATARLIVAGLSPDLYGRPDGLALALLTRARLRARRRHTSPRAELEGLLALKLQARAPRWRRAA